jgi:CRISPR-associated protein Csx16
MRMRLVSFLGTGRYEPTRHRFPDESMGTETKYFCRAIAEFVRADEIALVTTAEANAAHAEGIVEELRSANLPAPHFHPIPKGESELDLWRQFEVVKDLLRPTRGTGVVLDATHAFRSQPFFAAAVAAFVRAVDREPAALKIFYAAFQARTEDTTPVWELTPFIELLDWAQGMMLFLRTGRSADIADRTERLGRELARHWAEKREGERPNLLTLGRALRDFGSNLETVRTGDLLLSGFRGSAERLAAALGEARKGAASIPPLADVLDRLQHEMIEPLLGASEHLASGAGHRALRNLARLYLEMGRWAEAAAILREGWITRYATLGAAFGERNQVRPSIDEAARRNAEDLWSKQERDAVQRIAAVRNDIEHAGFKRQPLPAEFLQRDLHRLVIQFSSLSDIAEPLMLSGYPSVLVNITNHPSERWSPAQMEAALGFAVEIRDWPFPSVPPEADTSEIAELAECTAAQVIATVPGATHAMVQGEFTLVHACPRVATAPHRLPFRDHESGHSRRRW